jgi:hypothetical protein
MYMLGLAAVCWAIWKARNRTCFDKKHIKSPLDIIILACVFMRHWAGLYSDESKMAIEEGMDILMKMAVNLLGAKTKMKKEEPLPLKRGDQAELDGVGKADESKQMVASGGVNQVGAGNAHHHLQD